MPCSPKTGNAACAQINIAFKESNEQDKDKFIKEYKQACAERACSYYVDVRKEIEND